MLDDLPPKIVQDFYCDLSPLQSLLYEDFARTNEGKKLAAKMDKEEEEEDRHQSHDRKPKHHVLQVVEAVGCSLSL